jgi:hypothetical protein
MPSMSNKAFGFSYHGERMAVGYPAEIVPSWFGEVFNQMAWAYAMAARKSRFLERSVAPELLELVKRYLYHQNVTWTERPTLWESRSLPMNYQLSPMRITVMFTSGKDSLHALLRILELNPAENVQVIYVKGLNRSETHYENKAIPAIAKKLGVRFKIVELTNSVKLNRAGHNIGLREQMILCLALPYILEWKSARVIYGLHEAFVTTIPPLYSSHKSAFEYFLGFLAHYIDDEISVKNHPDWPYVNEVSITKALIRDHNDLLDMSSSCYAQINWREQMHARLKAKFPDFPLYHGCGYCIKCLRINAVKLQGHPHEGMELWIRDMAREKFEDDHTLADALRELHQGETDVHSGN